MVCVGLPQLSNRGLIGLRRDPQSHIIVLCVQEVRDGIPLANTTREIPLHRVLQQMEGEMEEEAVRHRVCLGERMLQGWHLKQSAAHLCDVACFGSHLANKRARNRFRGECQQRLRMHAENAETIGQGGGNGPLPGVGSSAGWDLQ